MKLYPFNQPIILNDSIFVEYGGQTGTTSPSLRNSCYLMAEQRVSSYLDTLLLPTTITGSMDYTAACQQILVTDYGYVQQLLWVRIVDTEGNELHKLDTNSSFGAIREDTYGYVFAENVHTYYGSYFPSPTMPWKFQYAYMAGLPTGTANQPGILTALAQSAQLILNELQPLPANESTGDVGVTEFSSLQYSEKRKPWKNTIFGDSPKAAWIARILDSTIKKARRSAMLGRY